MLWGHIKWIGQEMAKKQTAIDIPLVTIAENWAPDGIMLYVPNGRLLPDRKSRFIPNSAKPMCHI